jgi:hypothetical protein
MTLKDHKNTTHVGVVDGSGIGLDMGRSDSDDSALRLTGGGVGVRPVYGVHIWNFYGPTGGGYTERNLFDAIGWCAKPL